MAATTYTYQKAVSAELLSDEISLSNITVALDRIDVVSSNVDIIFKNSLATEEQTTLTTLVTNHDPANYVDEKIEVKSVFQKVESDENIPFVYPSSRPMNHYTYFASEGDSGAPGTYGGGPRAEFKMLSTDVSKSVEVTFNELVYLKDGLIMAPNAPFGACVDVEVLLPNDYFILYFCKAVPLYGNFPVELNTEDRATLPQGWKLKMTIYNSTGTGDHEPPADFNVSARFELFRPHRNI